MVCEYGYVSIKFRLVKQLTESESRVLYRLAQNLYTTKKFLPVSAGADMDRLTWMVTSCRWRTLSFSQSMANNNKL